jgi:hypothetical protein
MVIFLRIRLWWTVHKTFTLRLAIILMTIAAAVWLGYESWRLLFQTGYWGALDLRTMRTRVGQWVSGVDVYRLSANAYYPPASHLLVWPLLGWLDETPSRWFWALTTLFALGWLIDLTVRETGASITRERLFVSLIPLSMYATGATIGNGQLLVHILPILLAGILLLRKTPHSWVEDLLPAALIVISLAKPNVSAPFFWIVIFVPGRLRPAIFAVLGYLGLSIFAASFQQTNLIELVREWIVVSSKYASAFGTENLSIWLGSLGLGTWMLPAALLVLGVLGVWVWHHRNEDLWILLGVTAVVARLWIYHFWYDDILLFLPMIALYRIARRESVTDEIRVIAGGLLAALLLLMIAPGGLYLLPSPWNTIYQVFQVIAWLAAMIFLMALSQIRESGSGKTARIVQSPCSSEMPLVKD